MNYLDPMVVRVWWSAAWRGLVWAFVLAFIVVGIGELNDDPMFVKNTMLLQYAAYILIYLYSLQASLRKHGLIKKPTIQTSTDTTTKP